MRAREPLLAVLLCLAGAFLVLVASGRAWVLVDLVPTPLLPPQALAVTGRDMSDGLAALGLAGLAGVPALAATRGRGRLFVGGILLAVGAGVVAVVAGLAASGLTRAALDTEFVRGNGAETAGSSVTAWPWACAAGGLLLALAGLLVAARGSRWGGLGRKYEPPQPARPAGEPDLWAALDRGEDPTGGEPATDPAPGRSDARD